jgi:predicted dehydrogenase
MTIRIAQVGVGYWGPNLARNFAATEGGELVALCDRDARRLAQIGRQLPGTRLVADYEDILADKSVDAVVIATPVATHFELAEAALSSGKHVFVEKPLATSSDECQRLIDLAEQNDRRLMVGHVFVYNAAVQAIKGYIDRGELGEIYYVYSQRLNLGQVRHDVNALWNFAPHDLSILGDWFDADPIGVSARGYSYVQPGIEDVVFMTLDYPGGIGANIHISWLDPLKVRRMTIVGSEKMLVYDDVSADAKVTIYDRGVSRREIDTLDDRGPIRSFGEFQLLLRAGDVLIPKLAFEEPLKVECQHFVDCIRTGSAPRSDGRAGLRVVRALEAAQRAMTAGLDAVANGLGAGA